MAGKARCSVSGGAPPFVGPVSLSASAKPPSRFGQASFSFWSSLLLVLVKPPSRFVRASSLLLLSCLPARAEFSLLSCRCHLLVSCESPFRPLGGVCVLWWSRGRQAWRACSLLLCGSSCRFHRAAFRPACVWGKWRTVVPYSFSLGWTVNAAACVGNRSGMRWRSQRHALASVAACVGEGCGACGHGHGRERLLCRARAGGASLLRGCYVAEKRKLLYLCMQMRTCMRARTYLG